MKIRYLLPLLCVCLTPAAAHPGEYDDMVLVPAGEFVMGSDLGSTDERPAHRVFVGDFFIDRYEVTNDEYAAFLNEMGNELEGGAHWIFIESEECGIEQVGKKFVAEEGYGDHPVVLVTYYGAEAYAAWAKKRLPTEAEWEKAARGGLGGKEYPWGNDIDTTRANYAKKRMGTTPVGIFAPNNFGLYDTAGNVAEMVSDYYADRYYYHSPTADPKGPETGERRVIRGGSWLSDPSGVTVFSREAGPVPYVSLPNMGFRCAKDVR
jgi:sulfatase modifying factor 1